MQVEQGTEQTIMTDGRRFDLKLGPFFFFNFNISFFFPILSALFFLNMGFVE